VFFTLTQKQNSTLIELGNLLRSQSYFHTTMTPESHRRVLERDGTELLASFDPTQLQVLQALFGWNKNVPAFWVAEAVREKLYQLGSAKGDFIRSPVRFSTLDSLLFLHSGFPTVEVDSVFFGPDSYRFVRYAKSQIKKDAKSIVDLGCGTGVGGLCLAKYLREQKDSAFEKLYLTDINEKALSVARVNAELAGEPHVEFIVSDLFANVPKDIDVVVANPPFIMDAQKRSYRHGGGVAGEGLSVRIVREALEYLKPGAQLILYTGTGVKGGQDLFWSQIKDLVAGTSYSYEEIDPDIFGEELSEASYRGIDRMSAVGLTLCKYG
jgi:SAM-dependent methyltransferase